MATTSRKTLLIGPRDHGRKMSLRQFCEADFQEGWLYELARGVVVVTDVPGLSHGLIVQRLSALFALYRVAHPGVVTYRAAGSDCRLRLPGMKSDRHPDQAVYLTSPPPGDETPWARWVPDLVVEVVSRGSKKRDLVEKRLEYLRAGVREYWVLEPNDRRFLALTRAADVWEDREVRAGAAYRPAVLPGLVVRVDDVLGPAAGV